jgi:threonine dehydrogenase-like Zn-dependent dehydrogenase
VLCNGICGTDVRILTGGHPSRAPVVLGHEVCAEVLEVGKGVPRGQVRAGDRVVIDGDIACPDRYPHSEKKRHRAEYCAACRKGQEENCRVMEREGTALGIFADGGLASTMLTPQGALYKIPKKLPADLACVAEPLSCVEHSVAQAGFASGATVLVLGGGPMGALYALKLRSLGARVLVNELDPIRHGLAKKYLEGPEFALNAADTPALELALKPILKDEAPDAVVDAVGVLADQAISIVRPGGTAVLLGMNQKAPPLRTRPYDIVRQGKRIVGSYIGKGYFPAALKTLANGLPGIEHFKYGPIPLDRVLVEGFPALGYDPKTGQDVPAKSLKVLIAP